MMASAAGREPETPAQDARTATALNSVATGMMFMFVILLVWIDISANTLTVFSLPDELKTMY
jgi:hypothetical protein